MLDSLLLSRPDNREIQLDLFLDYQSNVRLYPRFQEFLRTYYVLCSGSVGKK